MKCRPVYYLPNNTNTVSLTINKFIFTSNCIMNRDPNVFLAKADYFYNMARDNAYVPTVPPPGNGTNQDIIVDNSPNVDYGTTMNVPNDSVVEEIIIRPKQIKRGHGRYFDPVTKHYFKTEKVLEDSGIEINPRSGDVWYPQNDLSYQTIYDPLTGSYYDVEKVYNPRGDYSIQFQKLDYRPTKRPGNNFYQPAYKSCHSCRK